MEAFAFTVMIPFSYVLVYSCCCRDSEKTDSGIQNNFKKQLNISESAETNFLKVCADFPCKTQKERGLFKIISVYADISLLQSSYKKLF